MFHTKIRFSTVYLFSDEKLFITLSGLPYYTTFIPTSSDCKVGGFKIRFHLQTNFTPTSSDCKVGGYKIRFHLQTNFTPTSSDCKVAGYKIRFHLQTNFTSTKRRWI